MNDYKAIIDKLNMMEHPEGGYYRRNWQSLLSGDIKDSSGKVVFPDRKVGSSIIYLLPSSEVTAWHRVSCDEMWHFYGGTTLRMYLLSLSKGLETISLGPNVMKDEVVQLMVPRNTWFAAELVNENSYALCGCTLTPAFSYTDFELAEQSKLIDEFPKYKDVINKIFIRN